MSFKKEFKKQELTKKHSCQKEVLIRRWAVLYYAEKQKNGRECYLRFDLKNYCGLQVQIGIDLKIARIRLNHAVCSPGADWCSA